MNLSRKYIVIILAILVLLISAGAVIWKFDLISHSLNVNAGETFALKVGDAATIKDKQISLKLLDDGCYFFTCPPKEMCEEVDGFRCMWEAELITGDKIYPIQYTADFTFAYLPENNNYTLVYIYSENQKKDAVFTFTIDKVENICNRENTNNNDRDYCWSRASHDLGDSNYYCEKIENEDIKKKCLKDIR